MKTSLITQLVLFSLIVVIFASCGEDDEVKKSEETQNKNLPTLTINDTVQTYSSVLARLDGGFGIFETGFEDITGIGISILYNLPSANQLTLSFSNDDAEADCIHAGKYQTFTDNARKESPYGHGVVTYLDYANNKIYFSSESSKNQEITITSCDPNAKTVSGSFSLTITETSDSEDVLTVSGAFTDLAYSNNLQQDQNL